MTYAYAILKALKDFFAGKENVTSETDVPATVNEFKTFWNYILSKVD